jgi:uncharacterized membrane protein YhaH (DUF805 family)
MKMHAWNWGVVSETEGSTMPKGRKQFTIGWLMVLVAVCGFEVFNYQRRAKQAAEMKLANSLTDNMYLYLFGVLLFWVAYWVASSRLRAANLVATNRDKQVSDSGGTHA